MPRSQSEAASSGASSRATEGRPLLLLLDGHSLAYRAYFALPDSLRTSSGELTNAVHGFISMLIRLLVERTPAAIAVAFDVGEDEERTAAYEDYKACLLYTSDAADE